MGLAGLAAAGLTTAGLAATGLTTAGLTAAGLTRTATAAAATARAGRVLRPRRRGVRGTEAETEAEREGRRKCSTGQWVAGRHRRSASQNPFCAPSAAGMVASRIFTSVAKDNVRM